MCSLINTYLIAILCGFFGACTCLVLVLTKIYIPLANYALKLPSCLPTQIVLCVLQITVQRSFIDEQKQKAIARSKEHGVLMTATAAEFGIGGGSCRNQEQMKAPLGKKNVAGQLAN